MSKMDVVLGEIGKTRQSRSSGQVVWILLGPHSTGWMMVGAYTSDCLQIRASFCIAPSMFAADRVHLAS